MKLEILIFLGVLTFSQAQKVSDGTFGKTLTAQHFGEAAYADIKNLDNLAVQFYNNICHQNGRGDGCYKYVDLYGIQDKSFPYRKVDIVDISQLQYSVVQQVTKPSLVLSQDYCNSLNESGSFSFKKSTSTSSTCTWEITEGVSWQNGISLTVGIPELASTSFSETINLSFSSTQGQSTTHVDQWEIDTTVPVPPLTYVNATYGITEQDFDCTWTANVTIRGCVNVWFQDKIDGHWEWWYYVNEIYGSIPGFTCWYNDPQPGEDICSGSYCYYQAQGTYYGIGGASAHLTTSHQACTEENNHFLTE